MERFFKFWVFILLMTTASLKGEQIDVTSLSDLLVSGTLRNALSIAQDNDIIIFNTGLSGTILLLSPLPPISANIKIFGLPSGLVILSGNALQPALQVNAGRVEISDLPITASVTTGSGAGLFINDGAEVTYTRGSFTACVAQGAAGGAVHVGVDAIFTAVETTFNLNSSGGNGDDVFLSTGATFNYSCSTTIPSIEVFGTGQIFKKGSGTVTLTVPASTALVFIIEQGEVISTGVRTGPSYVLGTSKLEGSQTSLYVANHGTVKPSSSIGTMINTGHYYQSPAATLEIAITPSTTDLLQVGGHAFLNGTLSILPQSGSYAIGTMYTILTTGGTVNPSFQIVNSSSLTFAVHYFPQKVDIEIK